MARSRSREERDEVEAPPPNNAYTGMLAISLAATLTGLVFIWMDYSDYSAKPPKVSPPASVSQAEAGPAAAPEAAAPEPEPSAPRPPAKKGG